MRAQVARIRHDKRAAPQQLRIDARVRVRRAAARKDGQQRVAEQGNPLAAAAQHLVGEREIHAALRRPVGNLVPAETQVELNLRVQQTEALDPLREPPLGDARKRPDHDRFALRAGKLLALVAQLQKRLIRRLKIGEQVLGALGHRDAAVAAPEQAAAHLLLEVLHHLRQARLGIVQLLRRPAQAAQLNDCQKCPDFFVVHCPVRFLSL